MSPIAVSLSELIRCESKPTSLHVDHLHQSEMINCSNSLTLEGKVFGAVLLLFGSTWSSVRAVSGSVTGAVGSVGTILATVG